MLVACAFQRSLLYFPGRGLTSLKSVGLDDWKALTLRTEDGLSLTAWYKAPFDGASPVVMLMHGNAGSIADRLFKALPIAQAGHGVLLLEYRGYGGNPGNPTERGLYRDGAAGLAALAAEGVPPGRVVLYGESLGSGVATWLAARHTVAGLILEAPFTSVADVAQRRYPFLPAKWLTLDRFANIDRIAEVDAPLLVIHGERDRVAPVAMGKTLLQRAREPKLGFFPPGAGHNDLHRHGLLDTVLKFIDGLGEISAQPPE